MYCYLGLVEAQVICQKITLSIKIHCRLGQVFLATEGKKANIIIPQLGGVIE